MRKLDSAIGKIHQGDALSMMRELSAESFDLVVCDGPYAVTTHEWDNVADIQHFNLELLKSFSRLLKPGGAAHLFGKPDCVAFVDYRPCLTLQSRIVWYQPSRLTQGRVSCTNNCDVICYSIKGRAKTFIEASRARSRSEDRIRRSRPALPAGRLGARECKSQIISSKSAARKWKRRPRRMKSAGKSSLPTVHLPPGTPRHRRRRLSRSDAGVRAG